MTIKCQEFGEGAAITYVNATLAKWGSNSRPPGHKANATCLKHDDLDARYDCPLE
jgi:hypothetical protein